MCIRDSTQADSSTTRIYGGTGLGLAISHEIVEAMGGEIAYRPNPDHGSVFTFTAMFDLAEEEGPGDRAGGAEDAHARDLLAGRRALIVDDNETNRLILAEQVAWWGMDPGSASSAAEAMSLLRAGASYDVVLLDLATPEQDGLDLARQIRAEDTLGGLRLLMLTSVATLDPDEVTDAGVDQVLIKPVMSSLLRRGLLHVLTGEPMDDPVEQATSRGTLPSRGRVLVVEDNLVNQMVATGLLAALGYASDVAPDGLAAIKAVAENDFDAVLMDVQMPRMDGYTATRHIRATETGQRLPIIAMTAAAVEGERERCVAAGMDDYLTKPVDPTRLAETLERWVAAGASYADRLDMDRLEELRELDDPGDQTSYVDRAIENFLTGAVEEVTTVTAAAAAGRLDVVSAVAHRLAGSAFNLGAGILGEVAREAEQHATGGSLPDVTAVLPRLHEAMTADLDALRAYQREQFPVRST